MPSFCQLGQKAYVYADGGPFKFDGPVSIDVQQYNETFYPNIWYHRARIALAYCYYGTLRYDYGHWARPYTTEWHTINGVGGFPGWITGLRNGNDGSLIQADPQRFSPNPPNTLPRWTNWTGSDCSGKGREPLVYELLPPLRGLGGGGGHTENPVTNSGYKLIVNGATIKTSSAPIAYSVKCGDKCPPGEKWDPVSRSCCCENMPSLIAQVRGAVNIARGIKP